ncbi:SRPBCC family protein [Halosolutus gelatinilyticus]|uniref:SRPBCC family protein n=1 Tax=Halosolutus gelatinilyticus TaxID=2931975 RepID=UPI001FF6F09A|nr:SRPBCC family protein [Halosolutus gelatinilyticus]
MPEHSVDATAGGLSEATSPADFSGTGTDRDRRRRLGAAALGGALVIAGLRRRSLGGAAIAAAGGWLSYRAIAGGASGSGTSTDRSASARPESATIEQSITIGTPADELSELARDAGTLDRIAGSAADVTSLGAGRHRWTVRGPLDRRLSWETRLVDDESDERLRWEPIGRSALLDDLELRFDPASGDRGTKVTLRTRFTPPGGELGTKVLDRLDVVPETIVSQALDRFKSLAETGEIPTTTAGNPSARGTGDLV